MIWRFRVFAQGAAGAPGKEKKENKSFKPQASSLTVSPRDDRISYYERYKKETSKTSEEIPAIPGSGDQRHANEGLQGVVVCCTTGPEG